MPQPPARPRGLVAGCSIFALILILAYRSAFLSMDISSIAPWATALSAAAIVGVGVAGRTHLWSAGFWYEVTLGLDARTAAASTRIPRDGPDRRLQQCWERHGRGRGGAALYR